MSVQLMREDKLHQEDMEHEERAARAKERASAPIYKKAGKPQMLRSVPTRAVKTKHLTAKDLADMELDKFLAQDFTQL